MTRAEMDSLNVGDKIRVRTYDVNGEDYVWVDTEVNHVYQLTNGMRFLHGGLYSVWAVVNGMNQVLTPELTERR